MEMNLHNDESRYAEFLSNEISLLSEYLADESIPSGLKRRILLTYTNLYADMERMTDASIESLFTEINGNLYA